MACEYVKMPGGGIAIVCFRGRKPAPKCAWCAMTSTRLCDGRVNGKSCDKPMCAEHAFALDAKHDLCPPCRARWTGQEVVVNGVTLKP